MEKCENCAGTGVCKILYELCPEAFTLICVVCDGKGYIGVSNEDRR